MNTVDKVIKIATDEVGYLEKYESRLSKESGCIFEKTAGAGNDNITKYGYEMNKIYPATMDKFSLWCDAFVDWVFIRHMVSRLQNLFWVVFDDYTVASCKMYEKHNAIDKSPRIGDQVFFTKNGKSSGCYHTGIVYNVDTEYFYTIEGNTSNANTVVRNGGGVAKKKYKKSSYIGKVLFGHPKYDIAQKSIEAIAIEVKAGKWGNGEERKRKLIDAGYDYELVRKAVNKIYETN
jgi:Cpl-7 lysozyme C-terminal domain.